MISATLTGRSSPDYTRHGRRDLTMADPVSCLFYRTALTVLSVSPQLANAAVHSLVDRLCRHAESAVRSLRTRLWKMALDNRA
jgi:hypothetical protein